MERRLLEDLSASLQQHGVGCGSTLHLQVHKHLEAAAPPQDRSLDAHGAATAAPACHAATEPYFALLFEVSRCSSAAVRKGIWDTLMLLPMHAGIKASLERVCSGAAVAVAAGEACGSEEQGVTSLLEGILDASVHPAMRIMYGLQVLSEFIRPSTLRAPFCSGDRAFYAACVNFRRHFVRQDGLRRVLLVLHADGLPAGTDEITLRRCYHSCLHIWKCVTDFMQPKPKQTSPATGSEDEDLELPTDDDDDDDDDDESAMAVVPVEPLPRAPHAGPSAQAVLVPEGAGAEAHVSVAATVVAAAAIDVDEDDMAHEKIVSSEAEDKFLLECFFNVAWAAAGGRLGLRGHHAELGAHWRLLREHTAGAAAASTMPQIDDEDATLAELSLRCLMDLFKRHRMRTDASADSGEDLVLTLLGSETFPQTATDLLLYSRNESVRRMTKCLLLCMCEGQHHKLMDCNEVVCHRILDVLLGAMPHVEQHAASTCQQYFETLAQILGSQLVQRGRVDGEDGVRTVYCIAEKMRETLLQGELVWLRSARCGVHQMLLTGRLRCLRVLAVSVWSGRAAAEVQRRLVQDLVQDFLFPATRYLLGPSPEDQSDEEDGRRAKRRQTTAPSALPARVLPICAQQAARDAAYDLLKEITRYSVPALQQLVASLADVHTSCECVRSNKWEYTPELEARPNARWSLRRPLLTALANAW